MLKLLLVEDALRDARALRETLADVEGMQPPLIDHVTTLAAAEAALSSRHYDCVLLDLRLPDSEGVAGVDRIRERRPEVTLVVLTGYNDQQSALLALRHGAQDYVVKGKLDGNDLLRLLRHAVERNRLVTEMEQARQQEYHRASHDPLTGLPNRQLFTDRVRTALAQRRSGGCRLVLCFVDLDGFKAVNDQHGHATGDALLCAVAGVLQDSVRAGDTVARLGGDEFAVLLTQARDADEAARVAQRMVQRIAAIDRIDSKPLQIGASIGLALHPLHGRDCAQLLASADQAMYRAKSAGKGQWRFCTPLESPAAAAPAGPFDPSPLKLRYQPWFDAQSRACMGFEALIRRDEDTAADAALAQVQQQQAWPQLSHWVLEQACRNWIALSAVNAAPPRLAINLSAAELQSRDYASNTLRLLESLGMPCAALQLEVAEDDFATAPEGGTLWQNLSTLRHHGVRIAVDRFGRHEAALGRLAKLPVDVVKLDVRHVRELRTEPLTRAFLASVIGYALALGLETVLCGVETEGDLANLGTLSPGRLQGFGLSPPLLAGARLPC